MSREELWFWLAFGADISTASPNHDTLNGRSAAGAGLADAVGDVKLIVGCAGLTIGANIITHAGALFI